MVRSNVFEFFYSKLYSVYCPLALWGLDEDGTFVTKKSSTYGIVLTQTDSSGAVLLELENVLRNEEKELYWVESTHVGHKEKSRRLLRLFQRDLLPGVSGDILSAKSGRDTDNPPRKGVSAKTKILFYIIIMVINALQLFYILLFAIKQTKYRQRAWFQSFMLWFTTEILFTATAVVWILNYLIPIVIIGDIRKLERKMVSILHDAIASSSKQKQQSEDTTGPNEFNSAEYLFVSRRIAKRLPTNSVAQLILTFKTPWPRQAYNRTKETNGGVFWEGFTFGIGNFLGMSVYGLGVFLRLPQGAQDGIVHVSSSIAGGYIVLFHTQLFLLFPALAFVPIFCLCIFIHYSLNHRQVKDKSYSVASMNDEHNVDNNASMSAAEEEEHISVPIKSIPNRRASLLHGITLIEGAQTQLVRGDNDSDSSIEYDSPEDSSSGVYCSIQESKSDDGSGNYSKSVVSEADQVRSRYLSINICNSESCTNSEFEDFSVNFDKSSDNGSTLNREINAEGSALSRQISHVLIDFGRASDQHSSGYSTPDSE